MDGPERIETAYDEERGIAVFHCVDATREQVLAEVAEMRDSWERGLRWHFLRLEEGHTPDPMFDLVHTAVFRNHPNRADHVEVRLDDVVIWVREGYDEGTVTIRPREPEDGGGGTIGDG